MTTIQHFIVGLCYYLICRCVVKTVLLVIRDKSSKKLSTSVPDTEIIPYIRDNPYRVDEREIDIDWEIMRNKARIMNTLGSYKYQKKYPGSNLSSWEHEELDDLEHDENVSKLGEDIPFEELKNNNDNNQKLLT